MTDELKYENAKCRAEMDKGRKKRAAGSTDICKRPLFLL